MSSDLRATSLPVSIRIDRLSRRRFMVSLGSLTVAIAFANRPIDAAQPGKPAGVAIAPFSPNAWVTVGADDSVTIIAPSAEMGQGVKTSLPLLVAEDMDADWDKVIIVQAPADAKRFGNPKFGGIQLTGGSQSTRGYYQMLRLAGAQTRRMLLIGAASLMRVPIGELSTQPNIVIHAASGRRLSYGAIAKSMRLPPQIATVTVADLKPPDAWRYIGRSMPRVDIPDKVNGVAQFGIDVQMPGMLYGIVARPSVSEEMIEALEDVAARAIPGVVEIVRLPHGVGVIADNYPAARKARDALKVRWSKQSRARGYTSDKVLDEFYAIAGDVSRTGAAVAKRGDVKAAFRGAAKIIRTSYLSEHVYHATMEPLSATALVSTEGVQVWGPTQNLTTWQLAAAQAVGTAPEKVSISTTLLGGGFGRKGETDYLLDAVLLAKAMPGRPVKIIWTREDDVRHGKYRPMAAQNIQIALDATGSIVGWHHRFVADSIFARVSPEMYARYGENVEGMDFNYAISNLLGEYVREDRGIDVGFWRAVGAGISKFAVECTVDEVAEATGNDPLQLRLQLLRNDARATRALETVAKMSDWHRKREGTALGLAYSDVYHTHVAQIAEVSLNRDTGQIKVHNVWCAVDCGVAIQPDNIVAQMEGGIIHGISHALYEKITIVNGEVQESNFNSYRVIRMAEIPDIHVQVLPSPESAPGGLGEAGLPPIGPAVANAVAVLTGGVRLRRYPFSPGQVLAALKVKNG